MPITSYHITALGTAKQSPAHETICAGVSLSGVVFVLCLLPETKGRSLQEIEESFQGAWGRSRELKEARAVTKGLKEEGALTKGLKEAGARSKGLHSCKGELSLHSSLVVQQTNDCTVNQL